MPDAPINPGSNQTVIRFGLFELDPRAGELRKSGIRIKLQEQPLQILLMLLEHPGEIVTREELQKRLWRQDLFVDFDRNLNSAVKKLRQALGDDSENPRFIETLYRRGYRFIGHTNGGATIAAPVSVPPFPPLPSEASANSEPLPGRAWARNLRALAWAIPALLVIVFAIAAVMFWWARPAAPPRITGYTQITNDDRPKRHIVTDGERLYFNELRGDRLVIAQVSAAGGETSVLPIPFGNVVIGDIAADGSALLVGSNDEGFGKMFQLASVPLPTGPPQRLHGLSTLSATWSRDRSSIVFASGSDIYSASGNGDQPRKLVTANGPVFDLRLSPDGRRLRFDVVNPTNASIALWEVNGDGNGLHALLPGGSQTPQDCCGNWTRDGMYYVFQRVRDGRTNLWALPEQKYGLGAPAPPIQLTNGPLDFSTAVPSKDGKKIFAVGARPRAELVRWNSGGRSGFAPYLGGISATDLAFSRDGEWVVYVSVPERILWRSKIDGSQRLQLTEAAMQSSLPRWSPDGRHIVFMGRTMNTNWRAYVIPSAGGALTDVAPGAEAGFDPGWSPDGKSIVLTLNDAGSPEIILSGPGIAIVDFETQKLSLVPGAAQLFSPRWSPQGNLIAAITTDSQKLMLFDRGTGQWTELVNMPIGYPSWSHDGRYLYFDTTFTEDPAFFRVRISDRKLERLASLNGLQRFWGQFGSWTGLGPDDSLLLVRDTSSQEIYALELQVP
jgi:Tol biopolymer transport system component/DNA-binding winged helix-turn-helix (wHTH) protein